MGRTTHTMEPHTLHTKSSLSSWETFPQLAQISTVFFSFSPEGCCPSRY